MGKVKVTLMNSNATNTGVTAVRLTSKLGIRHTDVPSALEKSRKAPKIRK